MKDHKCACVQKFRADLIAVLRETETVDAGDEGPSTYRSAQDMLRDIADRLDRKDRAWMDGDCCTPE